MQNDALPRPAAPTPTRDIDGRYPRPQLRRDQWAELDGPWGFAHDDQDRGRHEAWAVDPTPFQAQITVPFPPESPASSIGDTTFHPVVWYRRAIEQSDLEAAGIGVQGGRVLLHFGAVDYRADVWVAGHFVGHHEGGQTPFSFDITDHLGALPAAIVVRAEDDPRDVAQPRGKQDWEEDPHGIWYHRTTGIWQPVWLEAVPSQHITRLAWTSNVPAGTVQLSLEFDRRPHTAAQVSTALWFAGQQLASTVITTAEPRTSLTVTIPQQANGQAYESLLWSPDHPRLIDCSVEVHFDDGTRDSVASYFGMRSVGWAGGHFMLNDRPHFVRAVLEQGYWPDTHLAAPSSDALREEVTLAKAMGFDTVRVHEKAEDPRYLFWADRLGLMVWGESASAYEFSATAMQASISEWTDLVRRDSSHPCIITWVPLNESWGIQHVAHDPAQLAYARAMLHLTKALDPTRPVVSNDGWEHAESDLWTIHDYGINGNELAPNYRDRQAVDHLLRGIGPLGRRMLLNGVEPEDRPVIVSEFGGVTYAPDQPGETWGYSTVDDEEGLERSLRDLFGALQSSPVLAGFCYTQLTDTLQEANGLSDQWRKPKLPVELIRKIVLGHTVDTSEHRRPKRPQERPVD